jgi:NodT family efflux transporter outer membrane factor (OMF) lipoprotein
VGNCAGRALSARPEGAVTIGPEHAVSISIMTPAKTVCFRLAHWLLLLLLVGGCADRNVRGTLPTLQPSPDFTELGSDTAPNQWWTAFADSQLDFHVGNGLSNNYSLQAASSRVQAARAVTRREASDFWPDIDGILGISTNGGPGENSETYSLGLDASYQVDLWGEIESRVEAQRLRANATCQDYHAVALGLSAEITSVWFSLIEAHAQAELLVEQIKTNRTGAELQEERFGLGFVRSADVLRQRQLLESTLEQAVVIESQIKLLEHQLAVLLGEMPQSASYDPGTSFPEMPPLPLTGLPSELLLRRPDIQRNYYALLAADRDLASAISQQFPRLNLSASLQNLSENPEDLLKDWFVSLGGQLIAPLFDGGQRKAEVDRSAAVKAQLFQEYAQSVLVAFREVEDALVEEEFQLQRIERLEKQAKLAGQASNQLREQYLIGDAQYLDVLNAITGQQRLQRNLLSAQLELRLIRVSLYLALAGNIDPNYDVNGFNELGLQPSTVSIASDKLQPVSEAQPINATNLETVEMPEFASEVPEIPDSPNIPDTTKPEKSLLDRLRGTTNDE